MNIKEKRKKILTLIKQTFDLLDPSGYNSEQYLLKFKNLSDNEFMKEMKKFLNDDEENFYMQFKPFSDKDLLINNIKKAADFLNIELDEYINLPFANPNGKNITTPTKVPVGYIHIKRLQQILQKNTSFTIDISNRNMKTGQTINKSKTGRVSDMESFALIAMGLENSAKELLGPRSDSMKAKNSMFKSIAVNDTVSLKDIPDDIEDKKSLRGVDMYLLCAGLKTNLVTEGSLLLNTLLERKNKNLKDRFNTDDI